MYANTADLIARYDIRDIQELVSDTGHQEEACNLPTNPALIAALEDASGIIDAELTRGERYQPADLAGLTGNSQSLLKRIACALAMVQLMERRPDRDPDRLERQEELARHYLKRLASGEDVFNLQPQQAAGTSDLTGPSVPDLYALDTTRFHTRHYYPSPRVPFSRR